MGYGKPLSKEAIIVQIDQDYRTVGKNRDVTLGMAGDPGAILDAVADAATGRADNGAAGRRGLMEKLRDTEGEATEKLMPLFLSDNDPIHAYRVAWEINEFLTEDTIYIGDVVTISAQAVQPRSPGQWMDPGALGALGIVTALYQREKSGCGQRALAAMQDGVLNLCRVNLRDQQRSAHGPLTEYPQYPNASSATLRSGNASGGSQPGWIVKCKG